MGKLRIEKKDADDGIECGALKILDTHPKAYLTVLKTDGRKSVHIFREIELDRSSERAVELMEAQQETDAEKPSEKKTETKTVEKE